MSRSNLIPIGYAAAVFEELALAGHSRIRVFRDAGLELDEQEILDPELQLPAPVFSHLYGVALRILEAETSLRADHSRMDKDVVDLLCHCLISCTRLDEAIDRAAAFLRAIGPLGTLLQRCQRGTAVRLSFDFMRRDDKRASLLVVLAAMNMLHQLFSWLIGKEIKLQSVSLRYAALQEQFLIAHGLGVPPAYGQTEDAITFSGHYLDQPIVRSPQDLREVIDYFPLDLHLCIDSHGTFSERVRRLISSALYRNQTIPGLRTCAQLLYVGETTLRRHLDQEGTRFTLIRTTCQREYVEYLLRFSGRTVEEIAGMAGFGDDRALRRAFRSWSGVSPSDFRSRGALPRQPRADRRKVKME